MRTKRGDEPRGERGEESGPKEVREEDNNNKTRRREEEEKENRIMKRRRQEDKKTTRKGTGTEKRRYKITRTK